MSYVSGDGGGEGGSVGRRRRGEEGKEKERGREEVRGRGKEGEREGWEEAKGRRR